MGHYYHQATAVAWLEAFIALADAFKTGFLPCDGWRMDCCPSFWRAAGNNASTDESNFPKINREDNNSHFPLKNLGNNNYPDFTSLKQLLNGQFKNPHFRCKNKFFEPINHQFKVLIAHFHPHWMNF